MKLPITLICTLIFAFLVVLSVFYPPAYAQTTYPVDDASGVSYKRGSLDLQAMSGNYLFHRNLTRNGVLTALSNSSTANSTGVLMFYRTTMPYLQKNQAQLYYFVSIHTLGPIRNHVILT